MDKLPVFVATNCSATQSISSKESLDGAELPSEMTNQEALEEWVKRLDDYEPEITPAELYRGIGFVSVAKMQQYIDADNIKIISIGQGLVGLKEKIVPYDLSIDPAHKNSLTRVVTKEVFSPPLWWSGLNNQKGNGDTPLLNWISSDECKLFILGCSGRFQSLIGDDLIGMMGMPNVRDKVRIVSTSGLSLPASIRSFILPYDRRIDKITGGNRNDGNQRAALHFLQMLSDDPELLEGTLEEHCHLVSQVLDDVAPSKDGDSRGVDIDEWLRQHPDVVATNTPEEALGMARTLYGLTSSANKFWRCWRQAKGNFKAPKATKVEKSAALNALKGITKQLEKTSAEAATWRDEEEAIKTLHIFVEALKENYPNAKFSSPEVFNWAEVYFEDIGQPVPSKFVSPNKIAHVLKAYADEVGLDRLTSASQVGGQVYALKQVPTQEALSEKA